MLSVTFFAFALLVPFVVCYDEKFDKIDVDKIINDDALFKQYMDCMLDKGPCDVENGGDFKKVFPEVLATACGNCTPIQKQNIRKTTKALQEKNPQLFNELKMKYDPKGEYEQKFKAFMAASD